MEKVEGKSTCRPVIIYIMHLCFHSQTSESRVSPRRIPPPPPHQTTYVWQHETLTILLSTEQGQSFHRDKQMQVGLVYRTMPSVQLNVRPPQ